MGEIISEGRLAQRESVMRLLPTARTLQLGYFMNNLKRKNYIGHSSLLSSEKPFLLQT